MRYRTVDELHHFVFKEAFIGDTLVTRDRFHLVLDNVTILPENSCNRDIREMRCNEMMFTLENAQITSLIEEGYKMYDADGNLAGTYDDVVIDEGNYYDVVKGFLAGSIYDLQKDSDEYIFFIDTEEHTFQMKVRAEHDVEEWDRFLTKELM